jgi:RHS repeat-associated protein
VRLGDGRSVAVTWPEPLPEPTVEGGVATFKVSESADLVVATTGSGVTTRIRLNEAPDSDDPVFKLGLRAQGVDVEQVSAGGLTIRDGKERLAGTSTLLAWDAQVDAGGDPLNVVELDASLEERSSKDDVTHHDLELTTPEGFLTDPQTVYPVTIDPDITTTQTRDTWVRQGQTSSYGSEYRLLVGKIDGSSNTNPARSYLKFYSAALQNEDRTILKAELGLYQFHAYTCNDRAMNVHGITENWAETITWSSMPPITSGAGSGSTSISENRGASGCSHGWIKINVKNLAQRWSNSSDSLTMQGVRLAASDETSVSWERRFCSMDPQSATTCDRASRTPYLKITYNSAPRIPTGFSMSPSSTVDDTRHTNTSAPVISLNLNDPELQKVQAQFELKRGATTLAVPDTAFTASGGRATRQLPSLTDGTYSLRFRAFDGELTSNWSNVRTFVVDSTPPPAPVVTCSNATSGAWYATRPTNLSETTCTVSGSGSATFDWTLGNTPQPSFQGSNSGTTTFGTFAIPEDGVFAVSVKARDRAGNVSAAGTFGFGIGKGGTISPGEGERTSSTVTVEAQAPTGASGAHIEHRPVGGEPDSWVNAVNVKTPGGMVWFGGITTSGAADTTGKLVWDVSAESGLTAPAVREMRVCFSYAGVDSCTPGREVTLVPSAFGSSFPTNEVGPGQVALFTGEFQLSESDVEVPAYSGSLSLGRSHRSMAGDVEPAQGIFGPGWVADLSGPEAGVAGMEVIDNTATEAAITLVDPEGDSYTYIHEENIASAQRVGTYVGDAETETDNDVLELYTDSGSTYLTLFEADETETTWKLVAGKWLVQEVEEAGDTGTTRFTHNAAGLVTGIYAPTPDGVTCNGTTQGAGCRALWLTYDSIAGQDRLVQVDLRIWDPKPTAEGTPGSGAGMVTVPVQKYSYNSNGTLKETWDPRLGDGSSALKMGYEYSTIGTKTVLSKVTPPGLTPWRIEYHTSGTKAGMFKAVKRAQVAPLTGDATWQVEYDVPLHGSGLPDLRLDATKTWGQEAAPVDAAIVFGPDAPGTSDKTYGTISYWDVEGRTTNTAQYGAGDWQIDSTVYDAKGNEVWSLDEGNRNAALAVDGDTAGVAQSLATLTVYNEEQPGIPAGTRVEQTWGPTRDVVLRDGTEISGRALTTTLYDDEAADESVPTPGRPTPDPDAPALNMAIEERAATVDAAGAVYDRTVTRHRYDPVVSGDGDGWELGTPTRTTVAYDTPVASTTLTRFDTEGRVIETRTPQGVQAVDGSANDARSTKTFYYTADNSSDESVCRNRPEWAGLECLTKTGDSTVPQTFSAGFDYLLNETRSVMSATGGVSGAMSRASVTVYDAAGRKVTEKVTVTGAPSADVAVPDVTYAYSPATGLQTSISAGSKTQSTTYDAWGRTLTQTDGSGNTSTTTYDTVGRVKTLDDGKGTYTYTYDGTDAAGKTERRGLVTKLDVGLASGPDEFQIASNADGSTYLIVYPNGVEATTTFDPTGAETGLSYVDDQGTEFASFVNTLDTESRVRFAESTGSTQAYTYDDRDRLVKVQDTAVSGCVTRQYGFSLDSNRTSLATSGPDANGACTTSGAVTATSTFDAADRITNSGYTYDALGRTRTVPKAHTDQPAGSDLTVAYHANDMVAKLSQTVVDEDLGNLAKTKSFTLDPSARLSTTSDTTAGVELRKTTNQYADGGDAPAWILTETRPNASTAWTTSWSRNVLGPDGDLALIQPNSGTPKIQITNLHGDVVTQIPNTTGAVAGIDAWAEASEYGLEKADGAALGQDYEWLGAERRAAAGIGGLILMGVRLYNPTTGRFLSRDPIPGGNDNTYIYPADPLNVFDVDGRWSIKNHFKKHWKKYAAVAAVAVPGLGYAAVAYRGYKLARGGIYIARAGKGKKYVGQSGNVGRRLEQHVRTGKLTKFQAKTARVKRVKGGKTQREIAEQRAIDKRGGIKGGKLANKVNPIGKKRRHLMK